MRAGASGPRLQRAPQDGETRSADPRHQVPFLALEGDGAQSQILGGGEIDCSYASPAPESGCKAFQGGRPPRRGEGHRVASLAVFYCVTLSKSHNPSYLASVYSCIKMEKNVTSVSWQVRIK